MWTKALAHLKNTAALFFWLGKQKSRGIEEDEGRLINRIQMEINVNAFWEDILV